MDLGVGAAELTAVEESVVRLGIELLDRVKGDLRDGSLAEGSLGPAMFFAEMCSCGFGQTFGDAALRELDRAITWVGQEKVGLSLYGGVLGVATVHSRLARDLIGEDVTDQYDWLDDAVLKYLRRPWSGFNYDLINGLVGFGVYAIHRYPSGGSTDCLIEILRTLERSAEILPIGRTWRTAMECMPAWQRRRFPDGHINVGVAHGVAGIVAMLAHAASLDACKDRARPLLEDATRWLAAQERSSDAIIRFPNWIDSNGPVWGGRSAWCYGDVGVGMALFVAGKRLGLDDIVTTAIRALRTADDPRATNGIVDAGLCHGAMGLAHILNRVSRIAKHDGLRRASVRWMHAGLALRRVDVPNCAGFAAYDPSAPEAERWRAALGFLEGVAGVGLALLAALSDRNPWWDELLLLPVGG